jgi:hypothetical protein
MNTFFERNISIFLFSDQQTTFISQKDYNNQTNLYSLRNQTLSSLSFDRSVLEKMGYVTTLVTDDAEDNVMEMNTCIWSIFPFSRSAIFFLKHL